MPKPYEEVILAEIRAASNGGLKYVTDIEITGRLANKLNLGRRDPMLEPIMREVRRVLREFYPGRIPYSAPRTAVKDHAGRRIETNPSDLQRHYLYEISLGRSELEQLFALACQTPDGSNIPVLQDLLKRLPWLRNFVHEHDCPQDDNCPCWHDGFEFGLGIEREPFHA